MKNISYPKPIGNRAVVVRDESSEKIGNILLPDMYHEGRKPIFATVIAVGPGKWKRGRRIKPDIKPGDQIVMRKYVMPGMDKNDPDANKGLSGADVKNDKTRLEWFTLIQDIDSEVLGILE